MTACLGRNFSIRDQWAMKRSLSLRGRIFVLLAALCMIVVIGGGVMIWYADRMDRIFTRTVEVDMAASEAVEDLLQALIKQKGLLSYYFMEENPVWLDRLDEHRRKFRSTVEKAERLASAGQDRETLQRILKEYDRYIRAKDSVIDLYRAGEREKGLVRHREIRTSFFEILDLCEAYDESYDERIHQSHEDSRKQAARIRQIAASAIMFATGLSLLLGSVLLTQVLRPIQRLATQTGRSGETPPGGNEVKALHRGVRDLIEGVDLAYSELEKSQARLLHTEKMATVGKLAAGVAHSIRNPLTSIKMRLFSLERALRVTSEQKEDLEVITEEIRHIDSIVQNFLEYSRPSTLNMQRISPSTVVDMTLQLLRHRLKSYGIEVRVNRTGPLPTVQADLDQLKEVFVNLLVNACEAMGKGGVIEIEEISHIESPPGTLAIIHVRDRGPGIPEEIQEKVFEPFYSTKEEGTGLGLSIAVRIVAQHGGRLTLKSKEGRGTTFTITLPSRGETIGNHPCR